MREAVPGQPLVIAASEWNTVRRIGKDPSPQIREVFESAENGYLTVSVRNGTGAAQSTGAVLAIEQPIYGPTINDETYRNRRAVRGIIPAWPNDIGNVVVLQHPMPDDPDITAMGIIRGVAHVLLYRRTAVTFDWCDVVDATTQWPAGKTLALAEMPQGSAYILWRDDANATTIVAGYESVDAYVILGPPREAQLEVKVTEANGIAAASSGEVEMWDVSGVQSATGYKFNAELDWLTGGKALAVGKEAVAHWRHRYKDWRLRQAECP